MAVAESLTGGMLSSRFAQATGASQWFGGGVVAYASEVKHRVLGVRPGPVVSRQAALDMAEGVAGLMGADCAVAVTGVAGPDPQDGQPPGTVWLAIVIGREADAVKLELSGTPAEICEQTCDRCVELLGLRLLSCDAGRG